MFDSTTCGRFRGGALSRRTGCLIQFLYYVFIGWWLGALAVTAAYLCFAFILTIPFGVIIVNRISLLMALRQPPIVITPWGEAAVRQHNIILRAIWFFVIGMPLGFWMFDRAPALLTLHRS